MLTRAMSYAFCFLVGLSPLALGSNRPLPWAYNALIAGICCLVLAGLLLTPRFRLPALQIRVILPSLLLWSLALSWAALQTVTLEGSSSLVHPSWSILSEVLGRDLGGRISVNPHETLLSASRLLTYFALFLCVFILARDPDNAALMLRGVVIFSVVYALYGLARYAGASEKILWFDEVRSTTLSASFINRNSAATYFGTAACAALGLLLRQARRLISEVEEGRAGRLQFQTLLRGLSGKLGLEFIVFCLLLTATLLTQSRAGIAATVAALFAGLVLYMTRGRLHSGGTMGMVIVGLILVAHFFVLQSSGSRVIERLAGTDLTTEGRFTVYRDTIVALRDHAIMGSGLGTFQDIYPLYRSQANAAAGVWDKAHSDYLEILLGLGIPVGGALILGLVLPAFACLRGIYRRGRGSHYPLVGVMASLLVGLHAFLDFSLQIQAVAMTFALLLAVGAAQSVSDRR